MEQVPFNARLAGLLGFNAGYVDTAGFLVLNGLFAAHVTGNFVTFGAAIAHGSLGALTKLMALPMFCVVVVLARIASVRLMRSGVVPVPALVSAKCVLLFIAAVIAISGGPFTGHNPWTEFSVGMTLVAAMAIQNAMQRMHFASAPPSTLMTGTTTQVMIDVADLIQGVQDEARAPALGRLRKMIPAICAFAGGCAMAAVGFMAAREWCLVVPPVVAVVTVVAVVRVGLTAGRVAGG